MAAFGSVKGVYFASVGRNTNEWVELAHYIAQKSAEMVENGKREALQAMKVLYCNVAQHKDIK